MQNQNLILKTDSYKCSHKLSYLPGTTSVYSYMESRVGSKFDETVVFGLQYILKEHLSKPITRDMVDEAELLISQHLGPQNFDRSQWDYIVDKYDGYLPIRIKAVPEGSVVPISNVLLTIENTDPECFWVTNYVESILMQMWYPVTVATLSRSIRKDLEWYIEATSDKGAEFVEYMLHDFGLRSCTSMETSAISSTAHSLNFSGSDTMTTMLFVREYYNTDGVFVHSIPASEHSVNSSNGKEGEIEVIKNLMDVYPTGYLSVVCDSFDIFETVGKTLGEDLKERIVKRDGTFVVRPDSGDPVTVMLKLLDIISNKFGYTLNSKGYKVLPDYINLIWGDGVDQAGVCEILEAMMENGWSACNTVFGMGGHLNQANLTRDTQKFAIKCSSQTRNGVDIDIKKQPVTAKGKVSKSGKMKLVWQENSHGKVMTTVPQSDPREDILEVVFEEGRVIKEYTFEEIRNRVRKN